LRRIRAELINSRSRVIVPLQVKITEVEETITRLEKGIEQDTQALIEASAKGNGNSIMRLSMSIHESREKIDYLFNELETLTVELDAKSREFEEKFEELKVAGG
jgi:ATP-binding cassette, subfamily F, member 3